MKRVKPLKASAVGKYINATIKPLKTSAEKVVYSKVYHAKCREYSKAGDDAATAKTKAAAAAIIAKNDFLEKLH